MNKYIKEFIEKHHLDFKGQCINGEYNGYDINIVMIQQPIRILIACDTLGKNNDVLTFISRYKKELHILNYTFCEYGLLMTMSLVTFKSFFANVEGCLSIIINYFNEEGFRGNNYCPICHESLDESKVNMSINGYYLNVHHDCYNELYKDIIDQETLENNLPNNYLRGLFGCIIGALIGGVIWVGVYFLGFIAGLVAILIAFFASKGYDIMKGKKNKVKLTMVVITTIVTIFLAFFVSYLIMISNLLKDAGLTDSAFRMLFSLLNTSAEIRGAFIYDFALSFVFGGVGIVYAVISIKRQQRKLSSTIRKE